MEGLFSECPGWLDEDLWRAYVDWRASLPKKQRLTSFARVLILNELSRLKAQGHNPDECLKQSLINCWLGVWPVKRDEMEVAAKVRIHPAATPASEVLGRAMTGEEKRQALARFKAQRGLQ